MQQGEYCETKRKLIGFSPRFKTITTYPNPLLLLSVRVKDMYHTLTGLVSPQSDVKLRNMSGTGWHREQPKHFASIGLKNFYGLWSSSM
jgi:hypothetical protein